MNNMRLAHVIPPLLITILLLMLLEIVGTVLLPIIGLTEYRLMFNILIILYLGLKLGSPYLPLMVLIIMYFHSFFSIEGWTTGTITGLVICMIIGNLRGLIHLSSTFLIIVVIQFLQVVWFLIASAILYLKFENISLIVTKFWRFIPESIAISLMAPFFFSLLDKIWRFDKASAIGEED